MKIAGFALIFLMNICHSAAAEVAPALNGIEFPKGYSRWQTIGLSHRIDKNLMRTILGNEVAVKAAKTGGSQSWPEGTVLAKVSWQQKNDENWPQAIVPGEFYQVEIMLKNTQKFAETGGWGFARWRGKELKPWGDNPGFAQECMACHSAVASHDYVFTKPVIWSDPD